MALTVRIPDVVNPIVVENEDLSIEEIRESLVALYPVVENAQATRSNGVVTFVRPTGGTKG